MIVTKKIELFEANTSRDGSGKMVTVFEAKRDCNVNLGLQITSAPSAFNKVIRLFLTNAEGVSRLFHEIISAGRFGAALQLHDLLIRKGWQLRLTQSDFKTEADVTNVMVHMYITEF